VDLSIRIVGSQPAVTARDQLRRWVADTISDRFEYQLTVAEQIGQDRITGFVSPTAG
jgi:hypothetical protein